MNKKWRLNTKIKWKRHNDITNFVFLASEWCKINLKSNKELPMVWVDWDKNKIFGEYTLEDNEIIVYPKRNINIRDLIDTVIHEWTHFLQDNKELEKSLKKYKFAVDLNPYEKEAVEMANRWVEKCWKDIKEGKVNI